MVLKQLKKGIWNLLYSAKATSFRSKGYPKVLPRTVWIAVTYACNSRCKMCGIWKRYKKNPRLSKEEMTFNEVTKFVRENKFLRDISLSGGEPFLKPDLEKMFLFLDNEGYSTGTATNSVATDHIIKTQKSLLKRLSGKRQHGLEVSIDGLGKEHDRVRGIPDLFDKAVKIVKWGLENQKKYPFFSINVSHTITSNNYKQLLEFIDFFVGLGLKPHQISFRPAQMSSSFYGDIDEKEIPRENLELIKEIKKVMKRYQYYREDWFYQNMINYLKNPSGFRIPCYAATTFAFIDPYWNVYPCITWSKPIGNLRDYEFSLKKLWASEEVKKIRKLIKKNKCPNCWTGCSTIPSRVSNTKLLIKYYMSLLKRRGKN